MKAIFVILGLMLCGALQTASAACWRTPDGQIIQAQSYSTPPMFGAKLTVCPPSTVLNKPKLAKAAPKRGITILDLGPYGGDCTDYVRSRVAGFPPGPVALSGAPTLVQIHDPAAASVGAIAVMFASDGAYTNTGHVAFVESVTRNSISLLEAPCGSHRLQRRTAVGSDLRDAATQLRIIGYWLHP